MREILFRGKQADNGEWVEGGIVHQTDWYGENVDRYFIIDGTSTQDYNIGYEYEVDPKTVGQYTGLTDKNGKKIFEGDFIGCRKFLGGNFVEYLVESGYVEIKDGAFGLHRKKLGYYEPLRWLKEYDYEFDVIGNLHDDPELLEEEE